MRKAVTMIGVVAVIGTVVVAVRAQETQLKSSLPEKIPLLFVQSAEGAELSNTTLTLKNVAPSTIYFSDRPKRLAGHVTREEFLNVWAEGKDSFRSDPPNATLSVLGGEKPVNAVVKLTNPRLQGHDLIYDVKILQGSPIKAGGAASLFIDCVAFATGVVVAPRPVVVAPVAPRAVVVY